MLSNCSLCTFQLKELWIANAAESPDAKISGECQPGKPISVFSDTPYKVTGWEGGKIVGHLIKDSTVGTTSK